MCGEPEEAWLLKNGAVALKNNKDKFVELRNKKGRHSWNAVDARAKVLVGVFFIPPHSAELPRAYFSPDTHRARWLSTKQGDNMSPGKPPASIYGQPNTSMYGSPAQVDQDLLPLSFTHLALTDTVGMQDFGSSTSSAPTGNISTGSSASAWGAPTDGVQHLVLSDSIRREDEEEKQSLREQLEQSRQEVEALNAKCESQDENLVAAKLDQNQRELEEMKGLAEQSEALILRLQSLADQSLQRISSHNPLL